MHKAFEYCYFIPLALSAIFSLRAFRLKWPKPYRAFSVFLFVTLFVELIAVLWKDFLYLHKTAWWSFSMHNLWLYNSYLIPQYLFYLFFYRKVIGLQKIRKAIDLAIVLFSAISILNIALIQGLYTPDNYTLILSCLLMLWLTTSYFYQLLKQDKIVVIHKEPLVWISCGAFFYHLGCLPYFVWFNALVMKNTAKAFSFLSIVVVLNSIMYSFYLIAFLWNKNFPKQTHLTL